MPLNLTPFSDELNARQPAAAGAAPAAPAEKPKLNPTPFSDELEAGNPDAEFDALLWKESGGKQLKKDGTPVTSNKGAIGIAQVMPKTAPEAAKLAGLEFDDLKYRTDADYNKALGRAYFNKQKADFGDTAKALAAYNAGPGALRAALAKAEDAGTPDQWLRFLPAETQAYVPAILQRAGSRPAASAVQDEFTGIRPRAVPERTALQAVGDVALGGAQGIVSGVGAIASAFGADNAVARGADDLTKTLGGMQSEQRQAQRADRAEAIKAADASGSTWEELKAYGGALLEAPVETIVNAVGTSAPTLLISLIPGLGQANAARLVAQGAVGAAMGAGAVKGSIYEGVEQQLKATGMSPDEAAKVAGAAQAYDSANSGQIALGALLGVVAGTSGAEAAIARLGGSAAAREAVQRGVLARTAIGAGTEAIPEAIQGGQERAATNIALQNEGFDVPTMQGVAGQALLEGAASAPMGGALGAMERHAPAVPPALQPVAEKAATPEGIISRAAVAGNTGPAADAARAAQPVPVDPAARLAELEAITAGTADQTNADGQIMPGTPSRFFTAEEATEYQQLRKQRDISLQPQQEAQAKAAEEQQKAAEQQAQASAETEKQRAEQAQKAQAEQLAGRAKQMADALRAPGTLDALRADTSPVQVQSVLKDLALAQSPSAQQAQREQAINRLEFALEWAGVNPAEIRAPAIEQIVGAATEGREEKPAPGLATKRAAVDRDAQLQTQIAGAGTEFAREQLQAQARTNLETRLNAPAAPAAAAPEPSATLTAEEQQRLEAAALAGSDAARKAEDEPRQVVIDRVLRNIEERGGVASPQEAQILAEAGAGKPYDRIDEALGPQLSADQKLTQATGIALDKAPRETITLAKDDIEQSKRRDEWQQIDDDLPDRESAERIIKMRTQGNSVVKPDPAWAGYEFRIGQNDRGFFTISARKPGDVQQSVDRTDTEPNSGSIAPNTTPAVFRKRRAELELIAERGLDTVKKTERGFVMTNAKNGEEFLLTGPADAQLARRAIADLVDRKAHAAATSPNNDRKEPSWAQIDAVNWKKGDRFRLNGQTLVIENPRGSKRRSRPDAAKQWETTVVHHYGDIAGTKGADGDPVDVFVGPRPDSDKIFVVDQNNADGSFDEHKVMMGFASEADARAGYLANYEKGWRGLGAITPMTPGQFASWVRSDGTQKPVKGNFDGAAGPAANSGAGGGNGRRGADAAAGVADRGVRGAVHDVGDVADAPAGRAAAGAEGDGASADGRRRSHVIIQVDGKEVTLETVDTQDLGKSQTRKGRPGKALSAADGELIRRLSTMMGKKVVFFRDPYGEVGDGFIKNGNVDTVFLNEVTTINPLSVFGHEFWHLVKHDQPEAYAAIQAVVAARMNRKRVGEMYVGKLKYTEGEALGELISDLGGDLMGDLTFWQEVFAQIEADNPGNSKGLIASLSDVFYGLVDRIIKAFTGRQDFGAEAFVTDMQAVRAAFKEGLAKYIANAGISRTAMQADILRAGAKRSAARNGNSSDNPGDDKGRNGAGAQPAKAGSGDGAPPVYGTARPDASTAVGVHFSKQPRTRLDAAYYGAGYKGLEAERLTGTNNADIRPRVFFYVDKGNGVRPEDGVGGVAHRAELRNLYDVWADPQALVKSNPGANNWERAILRAGFDGYLNLDPKLPQGFAVLVGKQHSNVPVQQFTPPGFSAPVAVETHIKKALMPGEIEAVDVSKIPGATLRYGNLTVPVESREQANAEMERISSPVRFSKARGADAPATQYAIVEAQFKGTDQWLKAPNGEPTKLNERQWVHVRTPAFKAWFGDWEKFAREHGEQGVWHDSDKAVSKVVDANGEPLVVYHGTDKGGFAAFEEARGTGRGDLGIFTTDSLPMARSYVRKNRTRMFTADDIGSADAEVRELDMPLPNGNRWVLSEQGGKKQTYFETEGEAYDALDRISDKKSGIYALFVNLRDPDEEHFEGAQWTGDRPEQYQVRNADDEPVYDESGREFFDLETANQLADENEGEVQPAESHSLTTDGAVAQARRMQRDGSIIRQVMDDGGGPGYDDVPADIFVAFKPDQVKSADFNDGSYNLSSDDVRLSKKRESDAGHKRESSGRYVGAPDWVGRSPQQLAVLRKKLRQLAEEGAPGRFWYENSSKAILELAGGDKAEAERIVSLIAIYSPNATVPANTSMALRAYFQWKAGVPIKAGLGEANKKATDLLLNGNPWSGIKTNSFYQNLMAEIDSSKLDEGVATMDMWMALAFDYGMKALDQGPKYRFAERETQRLAGEMEWKAHQVQAAIWTAMKGRIDPIRDELKQRELKLGIAEMIEKDGKPMFSYVASRRYDHFRLAHKMGMQYDLKQADVEASKYDFSDAIRARTAQLSWEATPGKSTGVLPGIFDAPIDQKFEYLHAVHDALTDDTGADLIAKQIGLPVGRTFFGFSAWQGDIGAGAQSLVGVAMEGAGDKRDLTPEARQLMNLYSAIKGYVLNQEAVVWHIPSYDGAQKNQNGYEGVFNRALSEQEMAALYAAMHAQFNTWDIAPGYTESGFRALNFAVDNKQFQAGMVKVLESLPDSFGGGQIKGRSYRSVGDYISNDWSEAPNGEDYVRTIEGAADGDRRAGRSDLHGWAADLRARVSAINAEFAKRYGWGEAGPAEAGPAEAREVKRSARRDSDPIDRPTRDEVYRRRGYDHLIKDGQPSARFSKGRREIQVDGAWHPVENANGQPLHGSVEAQRKFWQWFGDSKVVDDQGRPLVVYHGTPHGAFSRFVMGVDGAGWFAVDPEIADGFSEGHEGATVYPVYLALKNPLDGRTEEGRKIFRSLVNHSSNERISKELARAGYDGLISEEGEGKTSYLAFRPTQIKSATGNDGSFDPKDANITRSLRRGEILEPTQEELDIQDKLMKVESEASNAYGVARKAAIEELVADTIKKAPEAPEEAVRSIGVHLFANESGAGKRYDRKTHPLFAEYRRLEGEVKELRARRQALIDARVGPPEFLGVQQLGDFPRPQTETPAFKAWFKDSKVVDAQGRPLIAVHGTNRDFDAFRTVLPGDKQVSKNNWLGELGSWFAAPSPHAGYEVGEAEAMADTFAEMRARGDDVPAGAVVYPVFLSIQNPYELEGYESIAEERDDAGGGKAYREQLIAEGYDGIVIRESSTDTDGYRDDWIAFYPNQIKSAIGNDGSFDPKNDSITRSAPRAPWYSQLEVAIESVPDRLATMAAPQWKLWLDANASKLGVKKDEIEWSGLGDYLKLRGKDKVTRDELAGYVRDHGVKVQEVVLGAGRRFDSDEEAESYLGEQGYSEEMMQELRDRGIRQEAAREWLELNASEPKYAKDDYRLPGGTNYREVLLTLPDRQNAINEHRAFLARMRTQYPGTIAERNAAMTPQELETLRALGARANSQREAAPFHSGHWDQPNVLVHMRVQDHTDAEGKRVLLINEIQSDWAELSRKAREERIAEVQRERAISRDEAAKLVPVDWGFKGSVGQRSTEWTPVDTIGEFDSREEAEEFMARADIQGGVERSREQYGDESDIRLTIKEVTQNLMDGATAPLFQVIEEHKFREGAFVRQSGLPRAPFVTDTKSWVSLAIKRAITMAAREGYDKVAFVTGDQAADFFDLSKQISRVQFADNNSGGVAWAEMSGAPSRGRLKAWDHSGREVMDEFVQDPARELPDMIGKDATEKLLSQTGKNERTGGGTYARVKELSGLDLKVGGEGMAGFYDKIVPQVANDVLKKLGGGKVGEVALVRQGGKGRNIGMMLSDSGYGMYVVDKDTGEFYDEKTRAWTAKQPNITLGSHIAAKLVDELEANEDTERNQPGFDITPAMREKVTGGAPLFSKRRDVTSTPEFKTWFGDSKVVDADGKPMVVYRGRNYYSDDVASPLGVTFFAASTDHANAFARARLDNNFGFAPHVVPAYLSISNPFIVNAGRFSEKGAPERAEKWVAQARRDGHDGLIIRNFKDAGMGVGDTFAVFHPTQIKSATGNDGGFDPDSDDITRSRFRDIGLADGYKVSDLLDSSKTVSWWDKSVGTPYHLAQKFPAFKRVYDAIQAFIGDVSRYATRAADQAPSILPKLEHLADITKSPLSPEDVKALADPIFKGTLSYLRDADDKPVLTDDVGLAGVVWRDEELRSMWNLSDPQIALYREFRKATNRSIVDMGISHMLRYIGEDGLVIREAVLRAGTLRRAVDLIGNHLGELASQDPERAASLINTARSVREIAEQVHGLIAKGYAPLSRFGDYTVYVTRSDGKEQVFFGMYETQREANRAARAFREDPHFAGADVQTGTMSKEAHKLFKGITPETLALFGESLGLEESSSDQQSQVFQEYLKLTKANRSAMKHMIERKGVAGYSEDAGRVLASFVYSNARQTATNLHAGEILKSANDVPQGDLKDHAIKLADYAQNPQEEAQAIRGMMFTQYIGGSIASAVTNLTQSVTTTWPTLAQHFGIGKSGRALAAALPIVKNGAGTDVDLAAAMKRAEEEGVTAPQETHHLQAQAAGRGHLRSGDGTLTGDMLAKAGNGFAKAMMIWGKGFGWAEIINRKTAFVAAFNLARDKGMEKPYEFAVDMVAQTQFTMNKGNNPQWARGPVGATLFTFKKFMVNYLESLERKWSAGTPEGKKAFALQLAILFVLAGAGGFPFAEDLEDIIDGFAQRVLNKNFSSKAAKREFFAKILGDAGAEFVLNGVSGIAGVPIDLSGRLGLGNVVPGTGLALKKRDYARDTKEILGVGADFVSRMATGAGEAISGNARGAVESFLPVAATNAYKAKQMAELGYYQDLKGRKVIDTTVAEAVLKGIGFQPSSVARIQEATGIQQQLIAMAKIRESEIADLWAKGRIERKPDLVEDAQRQMAEWNKGNPSSPIDIDAKQINKRVQQANMTKAQRLAQTAPKEIRGDVKKALTVE